MAVAAATLLCSACGRPPEVEGEAWPLTVDEPGVVGYAAMPAAPSSLLHGVAADVLGWQPEGLAQVLPVAVVHLDPTTFGGRFAVVLAVEDGTAFLDSLDRCASVEPLGSGEYQALVRRDSELARGLTALDAMLSAGSRTDQIMAALSAMGDTGPQVIDFHALVDDGLAVITPSFEARGVTSAFARRVSGLRRQAAELPAGGGGRPPEAGLIVSFDVTRGRVVYHEQIKHAVDGLRTLVVGAQGAGLGMLLNDSLGDRDGASVDRPELPEISWDTVQALMEMADLGSVRAVQLSVRLDTAALADLQTTTPEVSGFVMRIDQDPTSPVGRLMASAAPAPRVPEALGVGRAEPDPFARALADFMLPLAESEHGRGGPARASIESLHELLLPWAGVITVLPWSGSGLVAAPLRDPSAVDPPALLAWFEPLLAGTGISLEGRIDSTADGRWQGLDDAGEPVLTAGVHDDVLWIGPGDIRDPPRALLESASASARGPMPGSGPALMLVDDLVQVLLEVSGDGEWQLDVHWEPDLLER